MKQFSLNLTIDNHAQMYDIYNQACYRFVQEHGSKMTHNIFSQYLIDLIEKDLECDN